MGHRFDGAATVGLRSGFSPRLGAGIGRLLDFTAATTSCTPCRTFTGAFLSREELRL